MSGRSRRRGFGYVRKLPSGRWQASYLGPDLVRRTAPHTFDAKADAEGWLGRRREEVVSGEWQPPVKVERVAVLTFEAYSTQWLRERALKPRTREGYEHLLSRYLRPVLGPMAIDAITPSVVRTWWSRLPADKPTVRARSYALLKAVMNTAVADEVIDSNPCRIRGAANTPRAREIRPATIGELEVIVEAMRGEEFRDETSHKEAMSGPLMLSKRASGACRGGSTCGPSQPFATNWRASITPSPSSMATSSTAGPTPSDSTQAAWSEAGRAKMTTERMRLASERGVGPSKRETYGPGIRTCRVSVQTRLPSAAAAAAAVSPPAELP